MALGYKGPKPKKPPAPLAPTLVLPSLQGKVTAESYFAMMSMFSRAKPLADLLVCWMQRHGYDELTIETCGPAAKGLAYRLTLRAKKSNL